jgi:hypothetical protein
VQVRTSSIARILRAAERALRRPGGRRRFEQGWLVYVQNGATETTVAMKVVTRVPTRTLAELAGPVPVLVVRPDLVDFGALESLGATIALNFAEDD